VATSHPKVLELPKYGGSKGTGKKLLAITSSTTEKSLYLNAYRWMPALINMAIEDDSELSKYHVVFNLIKVLSAIDIQAFSDVCQSSRAGDKVAKKRMDPMIQKAMMYDAHLSQSQFKIVRKYTIFSLGYNPWQPLKAVTEMDVDVFDVTVVPFTDSNRKRMAHYRPVDALYKWKLDNALANKDSVQQFNGNSDLKNISECHLVVGGDHGQGAFRFIANLLLFAKGAVHRFNIVFEEDFLCGFIECKKDTYDVLRSTIAKPINESLKRIAKAEELIFLRNKTDSSLFVEWGAANASIHVNNNSASIVHAIPIQLFLVGDLAFQLLAQGREGMSSYWCPRCQWGWSDWQAIQALPDGREQRVGKQWCWQDMQDKLAETKEMEQKCKSAKPQDRKGLLFEPLFDAIDTKNYLAPVLHSVDLFVNSAKDLLDAFIDHRVENRPVELIAARRLEADKKIVERKALDDLNSAEDLVEDSVACGEQTLIANANALLAQAKLQYKEAKKNFGSAAATARKLEKSKAYGAMSQALRQQIDGLLGELFNILRSSYHGGDYEGNYCRKLIRLSDRVMEAVQGLLLSVPRNQRAEGCSDEEITKYCKAFTRLFQYFDLLSSYCYQPYGSITDIQMVDIRKLGIFIDNLWRKLSRNVPPKVHTWQHLIEDLGRLRGMKSHQEAKLETAHQDGVKTDMRFRSLAGSIDKKIKCSVKYQANMTDPATKAKQEEVKASRARKLGAKSKADRQAKENEMKRQKQSHKTSILSLPEITDELPSMLELTVIDQLRKQQQAIAQLPMQVEPQNAP
jgi:hypothetical protein